MKDLGLNYKALTSPTRGMPKPLRAFVTPVGGVRQKWKCTHRHKIVDMINNWHEVKKLFGNSFRSSFHFSIATVKANGAPNVTPIGSLILGEPGHGIYFEEFTRQLPNSFDTNNRVCVLAVNSSKWFWVKSLFMGSFSDPPAVRLHGVAGSIREATTMEIELWHKRVKSVSFTKGHSMMWANMKTVREIEFTKIEPVHIGEMTRNTWNNSNLTERNA